MRISLQDQYTRSQPLKAQTSQVQAKTILRRETKCKTVHVLQGLVFVGISGVFGARNRSTRVKVAPLLFRLLFIFAKTSHLIQLLM